VCRCTELTSHRPARPGGVPLPRDVPPIRDERRLTRTTHDHFGFGVVVLSVVDLHHPADREAAFGHGDLLEPVAQQGQDCGTVFGTDPLGQGQGLGVTVDDLPAPIKHEDGHRNGVQRGERPQLRQ